VLELMVVQLELLLHQFLLVMFLFEKDYQQKLQFVVHQLERYQFFQLQEYREKQLVVQQQQRLVSL
jgi:hypothetical protein